MRRIETVEVLEALYKAPSEASLRKVAQRLTPAYRSWIAASRFCVISTVGPDGTDGTRWRRDRKGRSEKAAACDLCAYGKGGTPNCCH